MGGQWGLPKLSQPQGALPVLSQGHPRPESSTSLTYLWGDLPWGTVCDRKYLLGDCLMSAPHCTSQGHIFV